MSEFYRNTEEAENYDSDPFLMTDDVPFYLDMARAASTSGTVLEIACGTGRITLPIAREGIEIVGLDNSEAMLDVARRKAAGHEKVSWVQGDMRDFRLDQAFSLVIISYRSFLALLTVADQKACLRCIHEHLLPGGRLVLNFFQPSVEMIGEWQTSRRGSLQHMGSFTAGGRRREYWQRNSYDTAAQELFHTRLIEEVDAQGQVTSRRYSELHLRYIHRFEMEHLLTGSGFEVESLYGWFDKRPFDAGSREMIWVARKV